MAKEEGERAKLAAKIVQGFLKPAASMADWREKWKMINRAAGVVVGYAAARAHAGTGAGWVPESAVEVAESVVRAIEGGFQKEAWPVARQLTDGLRKRVAEVLVAMEVS